MAAGTAEEVRLTVQSTDPETKTGEGRQETSNIVKGECPTKGKQVTIEMALDPRTIQRGKISTTLTRQMRRYGPSRRTGRTGERGHRHKVGEGERKQEKE